MRAINGMTLLKLPILLKPAPALCKVLQYVVFQPLLHRLISNNIFFKKLRGFCILYILGWQLSRVMPSEWDIVSKLNLTWYSCIVFRTTVIHSNASRESVVYIHQCTNQPLSCVLVGWRNMSNLNTKSIPIWWLFQNYTRKTVVNSPVYLIYENY